MDYTPINPEPAYPKQETCGGYRTAAIQVKHVEPVSKPSILSKLLEVAIPILVWLAGSYLFGRIR